MREVFLERGFYEEGAFLSPWGGLTGAEYEEDESSLGRQQAMPQHGAFVKLSMHV